MTILNTSLTTTASSVYTSSGASAITTIHLCNYTASPVTVNLYAVPSGGTASNSNVLYSTVSVTAYNTLIIYQEKFILSNGDSIQASCSAANSVTVTVSSIGI